MVVDSTFRSPFFRPTAGCERKLATDNLTTRPASFQGRHLFVNIDNPQGELRLEVLDDDGHLVAPFTCDNCQPVQADATCQPVFWHGVDDLLRLAGKPVRFRFHLYDGRLYASWVSS